MKAELREESERRWTFWESLSAGDPKSVLPIVLNEARIYRGQAGIYADKPNTMHLSADGAGVAISILHSGHYYPDDLSDDGLIYHYPQTDRPPATDDGEIAALKNAKFLKLPIFTIIKHGTTREVRLSWVEDWDDQTKEFLVTYGEHAPAQSDASDLDAQPFELLDHRTHARVDVKQRKGGKKFKFQVESRYGASCAVCGWDVREVLEAAYVWAWADGGRDDARNGLPLCPTHHRAFDKGLWAIDPADLDIVTQDGGPTRTDLGITRQSLRHLPLPPHTDALKAAWGKWKSAT